MEEQEVAESRDRLANLVQLPAPMNKSDTRDSISSVDSDVSASLDRRRGSRAEDADHSDSASSDIDENKGHEGEDSGRDSFEDIPPRAEVDAKGTDNVNFL